MPPKKEKEAKEAEATIVNGTNINSLEGEQIKELTELKRKRSFEEEERNLYYRQLEAAREILKRQNAESIIQRKAIQNAQEDHSSELKVYKQRANYLKYELDNDMEAEKRNQETEKRATEEQRAKDRLDSAEEMTLAQRRASDEHQAFQQSVKEAVARLHAESADIRKNFTEALEDRCAYLLKEKEEAQEEVDIDLHSNCRRIDQQRLENISHLQTNFEKNFADVKRYFQELTYHNLSMVEDLKGQARKIKGHVSTLGNRLKSIQSQNKRHREPMKIRQNQLAELKKQVNIFHKDEAATTRVCEEITHLKAERELLRHQIAQMEDEFTKLQATLKDMRENYTAASLEAKKILGAEANVAQRKAAHLKNELDRMKNEIKEKLLNDNIDPQLFLDEVARFEKQCLDNISTKQNLQQTLAKMVKVYNDSLQTVRFLIEEFQLPMQEADIQPIQTTVKLANKPAEVFRLRHEKPKLS